MTELQELEDDLDRLTRIQPLVVEILNNLLKCAIEETDAAVHEALARLGQFCGSDRTYVFVVRDENLLDNSHEWCADGIEPMIGMLQGLDISLIDAWVDELRQDRPVHIADVEALPPQRSEREILLAQGIKSLLTVPMSDGGKLTGFVGFDAVRSKKAFLPGEIYLLKSVADVIMSVLWRRATDTAYRRAQAALDEERAFLDSILRTSVSGILAVDADREIVFANAAAERALGAGKGARLNFEGVTVTRLDGQPLLPDDLPVATVLRTNEPITDMRLALQQQDGTRRFLSFNAAPLFAGQADRCRVVCSVTDVTEEVLASQDLKAALQDAQQASRAKTRFLANMSHEMRTPLNGVLGVAELLDAALTDAEQRRMISVIRDSGELLLSIINDLLDMSKIEADRLEIEQVMFFPAELARRIEATHTVRASEKHISLSILTSSGADIPRLGDPNRILQIMHNVVGNALKFTEAGEVTMALSCVPGKPLVIDVRDTGIGMTEEQLSRIFEDFAQADTSISRRYGGTGLGMAIVRRLVTMMGGTIRINSRPGEGTQVRIALPLPMDETRPTAPIRPAEPASGGMGLRVLAADDNGTNRMILQAMLRNLGVEVVMVPGGIPALEAYEREKFDAVLLDISMPDLDGISVLRELRKRGNPPGSPPPPAIAVTANAMDHQIEAYRAAGFDGHIAKPISQKTLHEALERILAQHKMSRR
ncbi:hybrid sensor histidine kinase/response regulator [Halodurantibacterium flavum]|uniref:histidine kinase n=1 Tax=Halodurantibacterium flavum TaxID=1382802 RepID=A0ABW4S7H5_9RHOB